MCVGSPFGGRNRWGGRRLDQSLANHMPVFEVGEHGSSCNCPWCGHLQVNPQRRIAVHGKIKMKAIHGVLVCQNPLCIRVKLGLASLPRDLVSGVAMITIFTSIALSGSPPPPYQPGRYIQKQTTMMIMEKAKHLSQIEAIQGHAGILT